MVKQDPFIRQLVGPVERELAQKWKLNLKLKTIRDIANERHEVAHDPIKTDIPRLIKTDSFAVCSSTVNDVKACSRADDEIQMIVSISSSSTNSYVPPTTSSPSSMTTSSLQNLSSQSSISSPTVTISSSSLISSSSSAASLSSSSTISYSTANSSSYSAISYSNSSIPIEIQETTSRVSTVDKKSNFKNCFGTLCTFCWQKQSVHVPFAR
ncbi:unnamed protein product [Rotaria socialis]